VQNLSDKASLGIHNKNKQNKETALDLQKAYESKDLNLRKKFEKYRI